MDEELFERSLRQGSGLRQLVREGAGDNRVIVSNQFHTVAASICAGERAVQDVRAKGFLGFDQRLREVTRIGLTDANVVAVFDEHLGQRECKAVDLVHVTLNKEHATRLVGDRHTVREFRRSAETVQDGFFVVVACDTLKGLEDLSVFVSALVVDTVELFVQDRFDDGAEVSTPHRHSHGSSPP